MVFFHCFQSLFDLVNSGVRSTSIGYNTISAVSSAAAKMPEDRETKLGH
jgi:hypothetical protein